MKKTILFNPYASRP